jgi:hypothetical protein
MFGRCEIGFRAIVIFLHHEGIGMMDAAEPESGGLSYA